QIRSGVVPGAGTQTVAPGEPAQAPVQQSGGALQRAPAGAQASLHAYPPTPSGRHNPPQHCWSTEQGNPAGAQPAAAGTQRIGPPEVARQLSPPQQSSGLPQSSPSTRPRSASGRVALALRPTPSGPTLP